MLMSFKLFCFLEQVMYVRLGLCFLQYLFIERVLYWLFFLRNFLGLLLELMQILVRVLKIVCWVLLVCSVVLRNGSSSFRWLWFLILDINLLMLICEGLMVLRSCLIMFSLQLILSNLLIMVGVFVGLICWMYVLIVEKCWFWQRYRIKL